MLSQHDILASDGSAHTRQTGILTPVSDNSLNFIDGETYRGKKRKRDGSTMDDLLKDPFIVRPYPSSIHVKPRTLNPLVLLPRSHLPLSSLDVHSSTNPLPPSRLFETHVKILELEERMGSQPMVLIARLDDGRTLYAVEREDRGLYVLCQLGSWVNLQQLKSTAVVSKVESSPRTSEKRARDDTSEFLIIPEDNKFSKQKRLAMEALQSKVKRPIAILPELPTIPVESQPLPSSQPSSAPAKDLSTQLTAPEIFDNASLAYFAKGPLSRARAAFHLDYDSTLDMNEHITFLESLIMTTKLIDRKYNDGMPTCVSLIEVQDHSASDANQGEDRAKKRRSSKKMKPGKTGLYPLEDSLIAKFWATFEDEAESGASGFSREEINKLRISQLRIRETQLQMIVILEVLALRNLAPDLEGPGSDLPAALPTSECVDGKDKVVKTKKPDPLATLIDVHIDRLCIWQDIAAESTHIAIEDSQNAGMNGEGPNAGKHTENILRDFCVDVIGPFFSARLPDRCATINSKLGGPVAVAPPKARLSKSASFSGAASRPGAATKRPIPAKPRQSLTRVLTDERQRDRRSMSHGRGRSISLMRSATVPILPGLKREPSEAPFLSNIPISDSQSLKANRAGVLHSRRFSQREVDPSSLAPDVNFKAKKQAKIEAELKDAISALKKPNRGLAGKDIVETAEKRAASGSNRKSKNPIRNPLFQGVQITATPRMNRQIDMFSQPRPTLSNMIEEVETTAVPSSSLPTIPQSVVRPWGGLTTNPLQSTVLATPSRRANAKSQSSSSLLDIPPVDYGGHLLSSPLQPRRSVQLFGAVPDSVLRPASHPTMNQDIHETPIKKTAEKIVHGHPTPSSNKEYNGDETNKIAQMTHSIGRTNSSHENIYKSLGWDDGDDIDELS